MELDRKLYEIDTWCFNTCNRIVKELGKIHSKNVYYNAFIIELQKTDYTWKSDVKVPIKYKDAHVGDLTCDIVIDNMFVIFFSINRDEQEQHRHERPQPLHLVQPQQMPTIDHAQMIEFVNSRKAFKYGIICNWCKYGSRHVYDNKMGVLYRSYNKHYIQSDMNKSVTNP